MEHFMIRVMLSVFCDVIYYVSDDIFQTLKPLTSTLSRYLVVITAVINTHTHIDNITLKVFSNVHQRSKAHCVVITQRRGGGSGSVYVCVCLCIPLCYLYAQT